MNARFTDKQESVIRELFAGTRPSEIGPKLGMRPRTAKSHMRKIGTKLGIPTKSEYILHIRIVYLLWSLQHEIALKSIADACESQSVVSSQRDEARSIDLDRLNINFCHKLHNLRVPGSQRVN
jgi:DNA-binding CsgD family transcriptional regulator